MEKETISSKQAIAMIIIFVIGSSVVLGLSREAMQDSWISSIIGIVAFIPFSLVYARIMHLYPGLNVYDIAVKLFGNVCGKVIIALFTWYALHLGALVLRNFSEFMQISVFTETPQLPFLILMVLLAAYVVKSGLENLGKCSIIIVGVFIVVLSTVFAFSLSIFDYTNILPIMGQGVGKILSGAFTDFTFPMAETVLFMMIICSLKPEASSYKVYFWGAILGGFILLVGSIKNILAVGYPLLLEYNYPHYDATKLIVIGGVSSDVFARIEGSVALSFLLSGFVKVSVCLFAAVKGVDKLFNIGNYRKLVFPIAFVMMALATIIYTSNNEMMEWVPVYRYYALPFQVVLPLIIFIMAEIKKKKQDNANKNTKIPAKNGGAN